jgi:superfamily I DNA and/or RNA helicase
VDERRMNVALTRMRDGLVVIGDIFQFTRVSRGDALRESSSIRKLAHWALDEKSVVELSKASILALKG